MGFGHWIFEVMGQYLVFLVHSNEVRRMSFGVSGNLNLKKVRSNGYTVI